MFLFFLIGFNFNLRYLKCFPLNRNLFSGKPQSVHNCTVRNDTEGAVDIQCEPGYDGGLSQVFVLEVFSENLDSQEDGEILYRNLTDRTAPRFSLGKVASGVLYTARMYAANSKGKATPVTLPRFSFPGSENQMGESAINRYEWNTIKFCASALIIRARMLTPVGKEHYIKKITPIKCIYDLKSTKKVP